MTVVARCPAKVNLFLAVGPPDATGYHPLRTVFQAVSLYETVRVTTSTVDSFACHGAVLEEDNTVTKAWRLTREYVDLPKLRVELEKGLPSQAGLGGGSSDAAGFLRCAMTLTRGQFDMKSAHEVACAVGADVPFFLVGGMARGEGYGDCLSPMPDSPVRHLAIVKPEAGVPTSQAYARLDTRPREWRPFPEDPWTLYNDFELVMPPSCRDLKSRLIEEGAEQALLCGSGSAVFGLFAGESEAQAVASLLGGMACRTLTRKESLWTS